MGFAALFAYISQCEMVNQAYTVSLLFVYSNVPNTLKMIKFQTYKNHQERKTRQVYTLTTCFFKTQPQQVN